MTSMTHKLLCSAIFVAGLATGAVVDTWKFASEEDKDDVQDIFAQAFAE